MGILQDLLAAMMGKHRTAKARNLYIGLRTRRRGFIYHRWDCEFGGKIGFKGRLFESQAEARGNGFRPCKVCKPDRNPYKDGKE